MDWAKLGAGTADAELFAEVLARAGLPVIPPPEDWTLGAKVRMLDYVPKNKPFLYGDTAIPSEAQTLLDRSASRALEARWLLQGFYPCHDPRFTGTEVIGGCYGCKTDNIVDFGHVYSSKTSLVGLVEGIVSSLANWKLYACGITHHVWTDELITAGFGATFAHPLRPAEEVSAGSVLHTAYCCTHLLDWYRSVIAAAPGTKGALYRESVFRARVQIGVDELARILPLSTPAGAALIASLMGWGTQLLEG